MNTKTFFFFFLMLFIVSSCAPKITGTNVITIDKEKPQEAGKTFLVKEDAAICTQDGKPIIRKFATTWCPHCGWIKETYTKVIEEYVAKGEIVGHLWNVDIGDDSLTKKVELAVPQAEKDIFSKFNPKTSIPTFVFGCKYYRIGNAFEQQNNLAAEEAEFRAVIDKLLKEVNDET